MERFAEWVLTRVALWLSASLVAGYMHTNVQQVDGRVAQAFHRTVTMVLR